MKQIVLLDFFLHFLRETFKVHTLGLELITSVNWDTLENLLLHLITVDKYEVQLINLFSVFDFKRW